MTETDVGLVAGVRASTGNEHLRLDRTIRNPVDASADLGAGPVRKTISVVLRNTLMAGAVVSALGGAIRQQSRRAVTVSYFPNNESSS